MDKLRNNKYFLGVIVLSTIVLSVIATYTAYKLYELRDKPVAPNVPSGNVYAFSCEEYQLLIDTDGMVRISNVSGGAQPSQDIEIIIGGQSFGSFTIPALDPQTNAEIGGINLPAGDFNWNIDGDILCAGNQQGTLHETQTCNPFSVNIANAQTVPSPTPTSGAETQSTPTPTNTPTPSVTPTPTSSSTSGTNSSPTATPTPTTAVNNISQSSPESSQETQLLDSGIGFTTTITIFLSAVSFFGAALIFLKQYN